MWSQRSHRLLLHTAIGFSILMGLVVLRHSVNRDHYLTQDATRFTQQPPTRNSISSGRIDANSSCKSGNFSPHQGERRVYDLIMFSTELDWLEIRLHTLASYVDYFVIIESPTTFTGVAKPLVLKQNWNRFARFHKQMIYQVVEDPIDSSRIWDHEDYLRNSMLHAIFPTIEGKERAARHGDVLVVSDMDEIVRPEAMLVMRYCDIPARLTLRTQFFYYSFVWRHRGEQWPHPQATIYKGDVASTLSPNDLRMDLMGPGFAPFASLKRWWDRGTLWDAGWHCSSCFSTIEEFQTKMNSFSHQGLNTEDNQNAKTIAERVRSGQDLFGREGEMYDRVENNTDVPGFVLRQHADSGRFAYLLQEDALFE